MMICRAKVRQIIRFDDFSAKSFVTGYVFFRVRA